MNASWWFANFVSYQVQVAIVVVTAALLVRLLRIRDPKHRLGCSQGVLVLLLLLPIAQPWIESGRAPAFGFVVPAFTGKTAVAPAMQSPGLPQAALSVFAAGALLVLLRLLAGLVRLAVLRARSTAANELPEVIGQLRATLGVSVRIYFSQQPGPVTFGWRRPAILLPSDFGRLDPETQAAVACHEFLHVRRGDWIYVLGEEVIRALFWFHPAVLWLLERIRLYREQVVDEQAALITGSRKGYVRALVEVASVVRGPALAQAASFTRKRHLVQRVAQLLNKEEVSMSRSRAATTLASLLITLLITAAVGVRAFPLYAQQEPEVHKIGGDVTPPKLIYKVEPHYTDAARDAKIEGTVGLSVEIWEDGQAHNIRVVQALDSGLDQSAIDAITAWRFEPATRDGKKVRVQANVEVNFRLL